MMEADNKELEQKVLSFYEDIHRHPELGLKEKRTSGLVAGALGEMDGIEVERPTDTGVVGILRGGLPGKTIAFRADMDALPVDEQSDAGPRSETPGVMHACGHDGHTAMLLGAASVLAGQRESLAGEIRFIFQPAEEIGKGARELIAAGALGGVDRVYGAHLDVMHRTGTFGIKKGPIMAAAYSFNIEIRGKGGHAAFPYQAIDSVYIASQVIMGLHGIISRSVNPFHRAVITVTQVRASDAANIISEKVELGGTVRVLDPECEPVVFSRIEQVAKGICQANGAECSIRYESSGPILDNVPEECDFVSSVLKEEFGDGNVYEDAAVMGGENFSEYLRVAPGCFYKIGARPPEAAQVFPHHSPRFRFDPCALMFGVRACTSILSRATARQV